MLLRVTLNSIFWTLWIYVVLTNSSWLMSGSHSSLAWYFYLLRIMYVCIVNWNWVIEVKLFHLKRCLLVTILEWFRLNLYMKSARYEAKWYICNHSCIFFLIKCQCSLSHAVCELCMCIMLQLGEFALCSELVHLAVCCIAFMALYCNKTHSTQLHIICPLKNNLKYLPPLYWKANRTFYGTQCILVVVQVKNLFKFAQNNKFFRNNLVWFAKLSTVIRFVC